MTISSGRMLGETLNRRQIWLLLGSLMAAMFMGALDQTIIATAAPRIVSNLGSFSLLSWMFTAYMLTSTVVVPLVGKLSDIYGRKPFLMGGMVLFLLSSAGCGAAPNMVALIIGRGLQGIGGGVVFASVFATIGDLFPPSERGKYTGLFTGTFGLASIVGPAVGGLLTDHVGWRWVFYINVPVGAIALPAIWANLPRVGGGRRVRIDYLGALCLTVATTSGLLALSWSGQQYGWGSTPTLGLFGITLLALAAFVAQEQRHPAPIMPFKLFRNREFLLGNVIVLGLGLAMTGSIPYLPTFLQVARGATATASGLVTTPQSLGMLITSIVGGQLLSRHGRYKIMVIAGIVCVVVGVTLMQTLSQTSPTWHLSGIVFLIGMGSGLSMPVMGVVIQNAVSQEYLGVSTSTRQFFMQIGGVVGTALFGVILTTSFQAQFRQQVVPVTRASVSADVLKQFEDPTLTLDTGSFLRVQEQILALPDGDTHLSNARQAQRSAITSAIHRVFLCSTVIGGLLLILALLLKELPLRRSFGPSEPEEGRERAFSSPALTVH
jgi:EmrB/QacA subfamily drug resistance transporter